MLQSRDAWTEKKDDQAWKHEVVHYATWLKFDFAAAFLLWDGLWIVLEALLKDDLLLLQLLDYTLSFTQLVHPISNTTSAPSTVMQP